MQIQTKFWKVKTLVLKKNKINPKPQYQRSTVWDLSKNQLLIDSILREYDLPKIYLRETPNDLRFDFEVTDGQQRLRTMWAYSNDEFELGQSEIAGKNLKGVKFSSLPKELKNKFQEYELSISLIKKATDDEIRTLFARLQMGVSLNPAELRHAISSNIGKAIQMVINTHKFFNSDCKISNKRYKHQDYLDHVITLAHYHYKRDLKAPDIKHMYLDLALVRGVDFAEYLRKTNNILDRMHDINQFEKGLFKNKWTFVDTFWFLYLNHDKIKAIKNKKSAESLVRFEFKRKKYNKNPEKLIRDRNSKLYDKDMYDYIQAFKTQGGLVDNIKKRNLVFENYFSSTHFRYKK
jgi:hypothetical protein